MTDATTTLSETLYALNEVAQRAVIRDRVATDIRGNRIRERLTIHDPGPGATLARNLIDGREASEGEVCHLEGRIEVMDCPCKDGPVRSQCDPATGRIGATKALPGLLVECPSASEANIYPSYSEDAKSGFCIDCGSRQMTYATTTKGSPPSFVHNKVPNDDLVRLVQQERWLSAIGFILDTLAAVEAWTLYGEVLGILVRAGQNEVAHEQAFHDTLNALTAAVRGG